MANTPETYRFADDGTVPNSRLPMLVYRAAVPADPAAIERLFTENAWPAAWRDRIHPFHHFHDAAHEVLGVASGTARALFGGPGGVEIGVGPGDVIVLPAGVGHCAVSASPDLLIVGAYPRGTRTATHRGDPEKAASVRRAIAEVPMPEADPVAGRDGPLLQLWG